MKIAPSVENATQPAARVKPADRQEPVPEQPPRNDAPVQGFISPVINVDTQSGVAVLQFRDDQSGEVTVQFPSETVVRKYREGEVVAHGNAPAPSATGESSGNANPTEVAPAGSNSDAKGS